MQTMDQAVMSDTHPLTNSATGHDCDRISS